MHFHLVGLPHTQVTSAFSACPFTEKLWKFCKMMRPRGHRVTLYAGEQSEAEPDEHVTCFTEAERTAFLAGRHYTDPDWSADHPGWQAFNARAAAVIAERAGPRDFVCLTAGLSHKPIADALPHLRSLESSVGYAGTFSPYRVFESYAWMHTIYGAETKGRAGAAEGRWFDAVIPGAVDPAQFPFPTPKDDYYLFIGRLTARKGPQIAADVCRALGKPLVVAGPGEPPQHSRHVGVVGPKVRARLMGGARAVFVPTTYIEPFGNVAVEAMASGTPVITTDWGAFTETVDHGVTGFRCRTFAEFVAAAERAPDLDPQIIRDHALSRYALDAVAPQYEAYFERLALLWDGGWYATPR